jgi:lysophospholipase L1-like esterase
MSKGKLLLIISVVSVYLLAAGYYCSLINIYGDFKVEILDENNNNVESIKVYGIGGFNSKTRLNFNEDSYQSSKLYFFKRLEIDCSDFQASIFDVKIYDQNSLIVCDTMLSSGYIHSLDKFAINNSLGSKILFISYNILTHRVFIVVFGVFIIYSFFLILFLKINRVSFVLSVIAFLMLLIQVLQYLYYFQLRNSSGFFIICSLALFIIALIIGKNMSVRRKNVVLSVSSTFVSLILIELILRISGLFYTEFEKRFGYYESLQNQNEIKPLWIHKKNISYYLENIEYKFARSSNSIGLIGEELELVCAPDEIRIIALGDSFTEGDGAHCDSTWLKYLERKFISDSVTNLNFINAGVCGSDPFYEYRLLESQLLKYKPNIVIVSFGNELSDVICRGGMERFEKLNPAINSKWWEPIYKFSHFSRLIMHNLLGYNDLLLRKNEFDERKSKAIVDLKNIIDEFYESSKLNNFELVIVFYPLKDEIKTEAFEYNQELLNYANSKGITCVDLLNYYLINGLNSNNIHNYYWEQDGHHKAAGYEVYADGVYPKIKALINQPL